MQMVHARLLNEIWWDDSLLLGGSRLLQLAETVVTQTNHSGIQDAGVNKWSRDLPRRALSRYLR